MTVSQYTTDPELAAYYAKVAARWLAEGQSRATVDKILTAWAAEDAPESAIRPDEPDDDGSCSACQGTGIGAADGPCRECNGCGLEGGPWRPGRYGYDDDDAEVWA